MNARGVLGVSSPGDETFTAPLADANTRMGQASVNWLRISEIF